MTLQDEQSFDPDTVKRCHGLVLNMPDAFENNEFRHWLNAAAAGSGAPVMTWHRGGCPGEWSDVVVLVDPGLSGEGTATEMPKAIWEAIVRAVRRAQLPRSKEHVMVRLTNLNE